MTKALSIEMLEEKLKNETDKEKLKEEKNKDIKKIIEEHNKS
jgi:hypothetical protein